MRAVLPAVVLTLVACAPEHQVQGRPYSLQVPAGVDAATPLPLLIFAHGYAANGFVEDFNYPFSREVDAQRFLYALPDGTQDSLGMRFWNATDACCNFDQRPVDDVGFFRALIADVKAQRAVKPGHVFVVGHSNGGFLALRLACEAGDVIDGVVALAGSTWLDATRCPDGRDLPVLLVHGTDDATVPYLGKPGLYPGAHETGLRFATRAGCAGGWTTTGHDDFVGDAAEETVVEVVQGCTPAIELWSVVGAGHVPGFDARWMRATYDWLEAHAR
jgi:polyhydroxybutyrate depolymerase